MTGLDLIRRLDDWSSRAEDAALAILHAAIATLVCAAVVFRYVLSDPLTWSEELILLLFAWMVFLGIASAFHARTHIIIDVIVMFAPRWLARAFGLLAFLGVFLWAFAARRARTVWTVLVVAAPLLAALGSFVQSQLV